MLRIFAHSLWRVLMLQRRSRAQLGSPQGNFQGPALKESALKHYVDDRIICCASPVERALRNAVMMTGSLLDPYLVSL